MTLHRTAWQTSLIPPCPVSRQTSLTDHALCPLSLAQDFKSFPTPYSINSQYQSMHPGIRGDPPCPPRCSAAFERSQGLSGSAWLPRPHEAGPSPAVGAPAICTSPVVFWPTFFHTMVALKNIFLAANGCLPAGRKKEEELAASHLRTSAAIDLSQQKGPAFSFQINMQMSVSNTSQGQVQNTAVLSRNIY